MSIAGYVFPDVSNYVHVTDWAAFAKTYPVAACKVSEGATYGDPYWPTFLTNCRSHGILPIGYHFLTRGANVNDQVGNYLKRLDGGPVGIALDVETNGANANPTVEQAHAWLDAVAARTHRPRSTMLAYMPRWWWQAHGGGATHLRDTICWLSDYGRSTNMSGYAGWSKPVLLQFSSTTRGAGMPPGDMNVAVGMTAVELAGRLGLAADAPKGDWLAMATKDDVKDAIRVVLKERLTEGQDTSVEALNRLRGIATDVAATMRLEDVKLRLDNQGNAILRICRSLDIDVSDLALDAPGGPSTPDVV